MIITQFIRDIVIKKGFILLSEFYLTQKRTMELKCKRGHTFRITAPEVHDLRKCPVCCKPTPVKRGKKKFDKQLLTPDQRKLKRRIYDHVKRTYSSMKLCNGGIGYDPSCRVFMNLPNFDFWQKDATGTHWCVTHNFPIEAFICHGITDIKIINDVRNLRIVKRQTGSKKDAVWNERDFRRFLKDLGVKETDT